MRLPRNNVAKTVRFYLAEHVMELHWESALVSVWVSAVTALQLEQLNERIIVLAHSRMVVIVVLHLLRRSVSEAMSGRHCRLVVVEVDSATEAVLSGICARLCNDARSSRRVEMRKRECITIVLELCGSDAG